MAYQRHGLTERKFEGHFAPVSKVPGNERARREWPRERKGPGAKVPGSELTRVLLADSLRGANWLRSEKAVNRCTNRGRALNTSRVWNISRGPGLHTDQV